MQPPIGRDAEINWAITTIDAGIPAEFHARCGFGKTTLLRYLVQRLGPEAGRPGVYVVAGRQHAADLLHQIAQQVGGPGGLALSGSIVAVDDLDCSDEQLTTLLEALHGCAVLVGAAQPTLGFRGRSMALSGLTVAGARTLVADDLGRSLTGDEAAAVARLTAAVRGQPLHLRQAAALVRAGEATFAGLARTPHLLDEKSHNRFSGPARRALQALALLAGAFLPANLVAAITDLNEASEALQDLWRAHIVERTDNQTFDRFMLPVCRAATYRAEAMRYLDLGQAAQIIADWLAGQDPRADTTLDVASAALTLAEELAQQHDWTSVLALAQALEPIMRLAGRTEAWRQVIDLATAASHGTTTGGTSPRRVPKFGRPLAIVAGVVALVLAVGAVRAAADAVVKFLAKPTSSPTVTPQPSPPPTAGPSGPTPTPSQTPSPPRSTVTTSPSRPDGEPPTVDPQGRDFGQQPVGTGAKQTFTVRNPTRQTMTIKDVRVDNQNFALGGTACRGQQLEPTAKCQITVDFRPNAIGPHQGQLVVVDGQGHQAAANLSGKGTATLTVRIVNLKGNTGNGLGTVKDDKGLVSCTKICHVTIDDAGKTNVTLTEIPPPFHGPDGIVFVEWRGACTGEAPTCPVTVTKDRTVTAVFNFRVG
jgi:hypothetical protein